MTLDNLKQAGWIDAAGRPGSVDHVFKSILETPDPVELSLGLEAGAITPEAASKKATDMRSGVSQDAAGRISSSSEYEVARPDVTGQLVRLALEGRDKPSFAIRTDSGGVWGLPFIDSELRKRMVNAKNLGNGTFNQETLALDLVEIDGEEIVLTTDHSMGL